MADGSIMIETKLSTDKFDKQITDLEKKIRNEENKAQLKLKAKLQAEDELERHKQAIFEIEKEYEKTSQQVEHLQSIMSKQSQGISLTPQEFTDLQGSEKVIANNEKIGETLDKMYAKEVKLNNAVDRTTLAYKQIKDNVTSYKTKIESVNIQKQQAQVNNIKDGFDKMNKSVGNSIKHIGRLALGIFSVASAYRLMSSASSTLGQYDEQYATNLEYIRYLISQAIAPALKYVVNLASTLLSYLNYIAQAWFGITLFSKNSAKNFMNAKNSTGGISKNTGKIKKDLQTTPFDEMNVLSDTPDGGTSGGAGGGAVAPSIAPSVLQGEVPDWLKWIAENKDLVIGALTGIAGGILAIKLGLGLIMGLGIGIAIAGIVKTIKAIIDFINDPSWDNFAEILKGLAILLTGVAIAMLAVNAANPVAWIVLAIALIVALAAVIIKNWDKIKEVLGKVGDWINKNIIQPVANFFKGLWNGIVTGVTNAVQGVKNAFNAVVTFFKNIINKIVGLFTTIGTKVGNAVSGAFKAVVNAVLRTIENILNSPIRAVNSLINVINAIPGINIGRLPTFNLPRLAKGTILNAPGRGVPVAGGTALAGEAGREAYLPLSDTQLLEELGSTIGKYINLNATIPIYVGNRQIAREIKRINAESDFAFNR